MSAAPHSHAASSKMMNTDTLVFSLPPNQDMLSKRQEKYAQQMKASYPSQPTPIASAFPPPAANRSVGGSGGGSSLLVLPSGNSGAAPAPAQTAQQQQQPASNKEKKPKPNKESPAKKSVPMSEEDEAQSGEEDEYEDQGEQEEEQPAPPPKPTKPKKKDSQAEPTKPVKRKAPASADPPAERKAVKKPRKEPVKNPSAKKRTVDARAVAAEDHGVSASDEAASAPTAAVLPPQMPSFLPSSYPVSMAPWQCQYCHQWSLHPMNAATAIPSATAVRSPVKMSSNVNAQADEESDDGNAEKKKKTRKRRTKQKLLEPTMVKYRARMEALLNKTDLEKLNDSYLSDFKLNDVLDASMGKLVHHAQVLKEIVEARGGKIRGFASENKKNDGKFVFPLPSGEKRVEEGGTGRTVYVGKANRFTKHNESSYCLKKEDVVYATPPK